MSGQLVVPQLTQCLRGTYAELTHELSFERRRPEPKHRTETFTQLEALTIENTNKQTNTHSNDVSNDHTK